MRRAAFAIGALAALSGCDLLFPEDTRLGVESVDACLERISSEQRDEAFDIITADGELVTPTFTYDITKVSAEGLDTLIVEGSDETAGRRLMQATNETSTAVNQFLNDPVDENGAFFFGRDPSYYRVRGEPLPLNEAMRAGCARQIAGMRFIRAQFSFPQSDPENSDDTSPEAEITE